jgi:hypothetical protein
VGFPSAFLPSLLFPSPITFLPPLSTLWRGLGASGETALILSVPQGGSRGSVRRTAVWWLFSMWSPEKGKRANGGDMGLWGGGSWITWLTSALSQNRSSQQPAVSLWLPATLAWLWLLFLTLLSGSLGSYLAQWQCLFDGLSHHTRLPKWRQSSAKQDQHTHSSLILVLAQSLHTPGAMSMWVEGRSNRAGRERLAGQVQTSSLWPQGL